MNPAISDAARTAVDIALSILPPFMDTTDARVELFAIGFQESDFEHRRQMNNGPAASFWQFEKGGGIYGVLTHSASKILAAKLCEARGVLANPVTVWEAMLTDDVIGAGFARLLLFTDPQRLPKVPDVIDPARCVDPKDPKAPLSWRYYYRNWRPGRPHIKKWPASYAAALREVNS